MGSLMKRVLAIAVGAIVAILVFLVGGVKAAARREDDLRKEGDAAATAGKAAKAAKAAKIKCWLPILALSFLASGPMHAQGSTEPKPEESKPVSTQPERLYTEAEALTVATDAAEAAVDAAIPLAVQAAVADERGRAAAQ
jgi:hypothetical protein